MPSASRGPCTVANQPRGPDASAMPAKKTREWTLMMEDRRSEGMESCRIVSCGTLLVASAK